MTLQEEFAWIPCLRDSFGCPCALIFMITVILHEMSFLRDLSSIWLLRIGFMMKRLFRSACTIDTTIKCP